MADEPKNLNDDEEYTFSDKSSSDLYGSGALGTKRSEVGLKIKRYILIGIGLIIVVLAVYKMLDVFFASTPKAPSEVVQPLPPKPIKKIDTSQELLGKRLDDVEKKSQAREDRLVEMFKALQRFETSVKGVDTKITELNSSVDSLNKQLQQQELQIQALKKKPRKRRVVRKAPAPREKLFLQAIIPGRAWLKSSQGVPYTVQKGDRIPRYGVVRMIDPNQGRVYTSTGDIIKFNPSEN